MQPFKTAAQAMMPQCQGTAVIAGQLIQDAGNLGGVLVDPNLSHELKIRPGQSFTVKNGWLRRTNRRSSFVKCRYVNGGIGPLCVRRNTDESDDES